MQPLAEDVRGSLQWQRFMQVRSIIRHVQHDARRAVYYWFSAKCGVALGLVRAAPVSSNYTTIDGASVQNYCGVSSATMKNDAYWL